MATSGFVTLFDDMRLELQNNIGEEVVEVAPESNVASTIEVADTGEEIVEVTSEPVASPSEIAITTDSNEQVITTTAQQSSGTSAISQRGTKSGRGRVEPKKSKNQIPPENVLDVVPYKEPIQVFDPKKLAYIVDNIKDFNTKKLKELLQLANLSDNGSKSELQQKVRKFYRKQYASYLIRNENFLSSRMENKTLKYYDYLVAIDFECTCIEVIDKYPHEIIEFPAVLIDVKELKIVDKFRAFVKPVKNPILDPFCINLTGITQEMVDNGISFPEALSKFYEFVYKHQLGYPNKRFAIITDGPHDIWKFLQFQCILSGIKVPSMFMNSVNLKRTFERPGAGRKLDRNNGKSGIQNMLQHYKLEFVGQKHSGLDDSVNLARVAIMMMKVDGIEIKVNQQLTKYIDTREANKNRDDATKSRTDGNTDMAWWKTTLPLKLKYVSREEFLSKSYLDNLSEE